MSLNNKRKRPSTGHAVSSGNAPTASRFASVDDIVRALGTSETSALGHALSQLTKACNIRPVPRAVLDYVERRPLGEEVLKALAVSTEANSIQLLPTTFDALAALLSLTPSSSSAGSILIRNLLKQHTNIIIRSFAPGRTAATTSALALLSTCAEWGEGSCAKMVLEEGMRWDFKTVGRLISMRGFAGKGKAVGNQGGGEGRSVRQLVAQLVFKLLSSLSLPLASKIELLQMKGLLRGLFEGLPKDSYHEVAYVLTSLWESAVRDEAWEATGLQGRKMALAEVQEARWEVFDESAVEAFVKLLSRSEEGGVGEEPNSELPEPISALAERFLSSLIIKITLPSSTTRRSTLRIEARVVTNILKHLNPTLSLTHQKLTLQILNARPGLATALWRRVAPEHTPTANLRWISSVGFATKVALIPPTLEHHDGSAQNATSLLAQCLPTPLNKQWYTKSLQNGNALVQHCALALLVGGMRKCAAMLRSLKYESLKAEEDGAGGRKGKWSELERKLREEVREVLPDTQVIVSVLQKAPGMALEHFSSIGGAGTVDADEDDPALSADLIAVNALAALALYYEITPSTSLRFDYAKLAPVFLRPTVEPMAALCQLHILTLLGAATTASGSLPTSTLLQALITLVASSPLGQIREASLETVKFILRVSGPVFEDAAGELEVWMDAVRAVGDSDGGGVVGFVDECLRALLREPLKYIEAAEDLAQSGAEAPSALSASLITNALARLGGQDTVSADVLMSFVNHVFLGLVLTTKTIESLSAFAKAFQSRSYTTFVGPSVVEILNCQPTTPIDWSLSLEKSFEIQTQVINLIQRRVASSKPAKGVVALDLAAAGPERRKRCLRLVLLALGGARGTNAEGKVLGTLLKIAGLVVVDEDLSTMFLEDGTVQELFREGVSDGTSLAMDCLQVVLAPSQFESGVELDEALLGKYVEALVESTHSKQLLDCARLILPHVSNEDKVRLMNRILTLDTADVSTVQALLSVACDSEELSGLSISTLPALTRLAIANPEDDALACLVDAATKIRSSSFSSEWMQVAEALSNDSEACAAAADLFAVLVARNAGVFDIVIRRFDWGGQGAAEDALPLIEACLNSAASDPTRWGKAQALLKTWSTQVVSALFGPNPPSEASTRRAAVIAFAVLAARGIVSAKTIAPFLALEDLRPTYAESLEALNFLGPSDLEELASSVVDRVLRWLVRRYAEDELLDSATIELTVALDAELSGTRGANTNVSVHLSSPVIEAALQRWLASEQVMHLAQRLCRRTAVPEADVLRLFSFVVDSRDFNLIASATQSHDQRTAVLKVVASLAQISPVTMARANATEALLPFYRATVDEADRSLLHIFRAMECANGVSLMSAVRKWKPPGVSAGSTPVDALLALDSVMLDFSGLSALGDRDASSGDGVLAYDPAFLLPFYGMIINSAEKIDVHCWLGLARRGVIGVLVCGLVSPDKSLRLMADRCLSRTASLLKSLGHTDTEEILLPIDHLRHFYEGQASLPVPRLMAWFISRAIVILATPESPLYSEVSRFLLQRHLLNAQDVPMFYQLLYSSSDAANIDRIWLFDLLRDGLQNGQDWDILKSRQVHEIFNTAVLLGNDHSSTMAYLQIIRNASRHFSPCGELLRSGILVALKQLPISSPEESRLVVEIVYNLARSLSSGYLPPDFVGDTSVLLLAAQIDCRSSEHERLILETLHTISLRTDSTDIPSLCKARLSVLLPRTLQTARAAYPGTREQPERGLSIAHGIVRSLGIASHTGLAPTADTIVIDESDQENSAI